VQCNVCELLALCSSLYDVKKHFPGISDLDSFDEGSLMKIKPPGTGGILDSSKIDAL